jgi:uncharacterized protein with WD repeat
MTLKAHEVYNSITTKALLETQKKIKFVYDYEVLSGSGLKFYVSIETKQMVPILAGKSVMRLTEIPDEYGRHIVYAQNQKILVPESDIISIGLN